MRAIKTMQARIPDLEAALDKAQSQLSPQPHPLLHEQKKLKETNLYINENEKDEVYEVADLIGSLAIGDQGQTRFHGESSTPEVYLLFRY